MLLPFFAVSCNFYNFDADFNANLTFLIDSQTKVSARKSISKLNICSRYAYMCEPLRNKNVTPKV